MIKYTMEKRGDKAVNTIKVIRNYTGLGLKEAIELSEKAPLNLNGLVGSKYLREFAETLASVGATVTVTKRTMFGNKTKQICGHDPFL